MGGRAATARERLDAILATCRSCGREHRGLFDLAAFAPAHWTGPEAYELNSALRRDGDFLSEDFCVLGGEHFFVRGVLSLPVHGLDEDFGFGCWSTLSRAHFDAYVESFDEDGPAPAEPWTGWFSNTLKPYADSVNQPCRVHLGSAGRTRPSLVLADPDHPLARAAAEGIEIEHLLEIYRANGHELDAPSA